MRAELQPSDGWLDSRPSNQAPIRVVHVWALSCSLCKAQMPSVRRWMSLPGVEVVSVHTPIAPGDTDREQIAKVAAAYGLSAPVALDGDGRIADALGIRSLPAYLVYEGDALILAAAGAGAAQQVDLTLRGLRRAK